MLFPPFLFSRTFLRELELYADCPELVGRCFLERVSEWSHCAKKKKKWKTWFSTFFFHHFLDTTHLSSLRWQTCRSTRSTVTTSLAPKASGGSAQTQSSSRYCQHMPVVILCLSVWRPYFSIFTRSVRKSWSTNLVWIPICWSLCRELQNTNCCWR